MTRVLLLAILAATRRVANPSIRVALLFAKKSSHNLDGERVESDVREREGRRERKEERALSLAFNSHV